MTARPLVVAIVGAESAGKTTLSHGLATRFGAPLVPEVARDYLTGRLTYEALDLIEIARRQHAAEQRVAATETKLVIADTDLVVIAIWWQVKYGRLPGALSRTLRHGLQSADRRYLVPKPSIPWEPDPLRENPTDREALHTRYVRFLRRRKLEYVEIEGDPEARLRDATAIVEAWLSSRAN